MPPGNKDDLISLVMKSAILTLLIFAVACAEFSPSVWGEFRYDSNICSLSDGEIDEFLSGGSGFLQKTVDDGIFRAGFSADLTAKRNKTKFGAGFSVRGAKYIKNSPKDYISGSGYIFARRGGLKFEISFGWTPRYTTRSYYDPETDAPQWCSYSSLWGATKVSVRIVPYLYASVRYKRSGYLYNDYFPEYDSQRDEIDISVSRYGKVDFSLGYRFTRSDARGYDTAGETKESSDEGDISYEQDLGYAGIDWDFAVFSRRARGFLDLKLAHRVYTSQKNYWVDPLHLGREEFVFTGQAGAKLFAAENVWIKPFVRFIMRRAESEYNPDIPQLRNYNRWIFGIGMGRDF